MGPTNLVVTWTLAGAAANATTCAAQNAYQIYVNVSGTIDPSSHQSVTIECSAGSTTFPQLLVQDLGTPYVEGTLLSATGASVAIVGVDVSPTLGTTPVTLAFFPPAGTGGASTTSSSGTTSATTTSSTTTSSTSSTTSTSSSTGSSSSSGASTTSSSSSSSSSSAASSSSTSASSSSG